MTVARVIRYRTKPDRAEENAKLIGAVFAELAEQAPDGMKYAAFRLDDGESFLHVAIFDGEDNPLAASPAFAAFQAGIGDRCAEPPAAVTAEVVGNYRWPAG